MARLTSGDGAAPAKAATNGPDLWADRLPWPTAESHKHNRGRLAVVGSSPSRTGAGRLAARAGLRVGAGYVRMLCPRSSTLVYATALEAVVVEPFADEDGLVALAQPNDAVVFGPAAGVSEQTRARLRWLAALEIAAVWDADALSAFEGAGEELCTLARESDVLTPHEGEFERVFPGLLGERGREGAAVEAARRCGATVVLKGARTVVAGSDGRRAVNTVDAPWLATLGTGDVLSGMIGGLLAQGMAGFDAACAAVWLHASAARAFGPGLTAEDLPDLLPARLRELYAARADGQSGTTGDRSGG